MTTSNAKYELRNCSWGFRCEQTWESLIATDSPVEKYCGECERSVHLCDTFDDLASTVANNHCAAFPARLLDQTEDDVMMVGSVRQNYIPLDNS